MEIKPKMNQSNNQIENNFITNSKTKIVRTLALTKAPIVGAPFNSF